MTQVKNHRVYFDVTIAGDPVGRVVFELFSSEVPRAAQNFLSLCTGENGIGRLGYPLSYKGSQFHRIVPGFMCQGGDITDNDGSGGESIYGLSFADENFNVNHTPGCLSLANHGPNTNSSQFFVTTAETPHLDGRHVVFGRVFSGYDVIQQIEMVGSGSGNPRKHVVIEDCGQII